MKNVIAVLDKQLSKNGKKRYVVIDKITGEILDDAQGNGYTSSQKARAAYAYKTRKDDIDADSKAKKAKISAWARRNKSFMNLMDIVSLEISKGTWTPGMKFDTKMVKIMLDDNGLRLDGFTAYDLLKYWRNC